MAMPRNDYQCPVWNAETRQCSLTTYPCAKKRQMEKESCEYCLFQKKDACTYDEDVGLNEKNCKSQEWHSCQRMFKFAWNGHFRMTMPENKPFYRERFGQFEHQFHRKGCPYLHIEDRFFGSDKIMCLAQRSCREVTFSEFYWFCGGHLGSNFEQKRVFYQKSDSITSLLQTTFMDCPCFKDASVPINEILPTKKEVKLNAEEAMRKQERVINNINRFSEKAVEITNEAIKLSEKANKGSESGCFITTATLKAIGGKDDGYELNRFRHFRDVYLSSLTGGESLIKKYYEIAPQIVAKINDRSDADEVYEHIWNVYLSTCLELIENQKYEECKMCYSKMVNKLTDDFIKEGKI